MQNGHQWPRLNSTTFHGCRKPFGSSISEPSVSLNVSFGNRSPASRMLPPALAIFSPFCVLVKSDTATRGRCLLGRKSRVTQRGQHANTQRNRVPMFAAQSANPIDERPLEAGVLATGLAPREMLVDHRHLRRVE